MPDSVLYPRGVDPRLAVPDWQRGPVRERLAALDPRTPLALDGSFGAGRVEVLHCQLVTPFAVVLVLATRSA